MEVIAFKDSRWQEIPEQDNPALSYRNDRVSGWIRTKECIIVCKVADVRHSGVGDGYTVIFSGFEGDIIRRGIFWEFKMAIIFAKSLSENIPNDNK